MAEILTDLFSVEEQLTILGAPERYGEIPDRFFADFAYLGFFVYGRTSDESLIPALMSLYSHFVVVVPIDVRRRVYQEIISKLRRGEVTYDALFPFIYMEVERSIVSQAVIDFCMYRSIEGDDDLEGVKRLARLLIRQEVENNGALLAGLLLSGDRRVADLLSGYREGLATKEILDEFAKTQSRYLYAPVVEFYLDWLNELNAKEHEAEFGSLASGLVLMLRTDSAGTVTEGRRDFGLRGDQRPVEIVTQVPFAEYRDKVLPVMKKLAKTETEPKVMPTVIEAWMEHGASE